MADPTPTTDATPVLTINDLTNLLHDVADNHRLQLPHDNEYADWCLSTPYCDWQPAWSTRTNEDLVRDEHAYHLAQVQATALHQHLNPNASTDDH